MVRGAKFPADVKITCTKPAMPNRPPFHSFPPSVFEGKHRFIAKQKSAPLAYLHCVPEALPLCKSELERAVLVSREIGSQDLADIIWRLKPWHKHLDM